MFVVFVVFVLCLTKLLTCGVIRSCNKEEMAEKMFLSLPVSVHSLVGSTQWKGGALMKLKSEVQRPSSAEVAVNAPWIEPVLYFYPTKAWLEHISHGFHFPCFFLAEHLPMIYV